MIAISFPYFAIILVSYFSLTIFTYASEKLGWSKVKTDEILLPVLKRLNSKEVKNEEVIILKIFYHLIEVSVSIKDTHDVGSCFAHVEN